MTPGVHVRMADLPREFPEVQNLCREYREALLALGGDVTAAVEALYHPAAWDNLLESLPAKHARPKGSILLVEVDGEIAGCGMIQVLNEDDAEIKRVFVRPSAQGRGAGETLSRALVNQARADGFQRILLDTTKVSTPARRLYEKIGFTARGPYAAMPDFIVPLMAFYELHLQPTPAQSIPAAGLDAGLDQTSGMTAGEIIGTLGLHPHPEGGHYRETWAAANEGRPTGTCIYFLLAAGERSHWHRVDATEIWLYHSGAPLVLSISATEDGPATDHLLGPDLASARPQIIVPENHWQAARSTGDYTLVGCTVSPGFRFEGFTLAEPGFDIPRA